jgi:hypothetical protein
MADEKTKDSVTFEITFRGGSLSGDNREVNIKALQAAFEAALKSGSTLKDSFDANVLGADHTLDFGPPNRKL